MGRSALDAAWAPNWDDWSFLESTTRTLRQHDHLPWSDLQQYLRPHRLQSCLSHSHFSPWYCPAGVSVLLPLALQSLLEEVVAQPLPVTGAPGTFTRISSRIRSSLHPEVLILYKTCLAPPSHTPSTSEVEHVPSLNPLSISPLLTSRMIQAVRFFQTISLP